MWSTGVSYEEMEREVAARRIGSDVADGDGGEDELAMDDDGIAAWLDAEDSDDDLFGMDWTGETGE